MYKGTNRQGEGWEWEKGGTYEDLPDETFLLVFSFVPDGRELSLLAGVSAAGGQCAQELGSVGLPALELVTAGARVIGEIGGDCPPEMFEPAIGLVPRRQHRRRPAL